MVVSRVPWAEPGSRFMHDFETQCAWLMTVANQKTVSGFLRVAWRTAGEIARRVADRLEASMPSMFDGLTAIGVDETVGTARATRTSPSSSTDERKAGHLGARTDTARRSSTCSSSG